MESSRLSHQKIIAILKQHESILSVSDICRKHGIGQISFINDAQSLAT